MSTCETVVCALGLFLIGWLIGEFIRRGRP